MWAFIVVDAIRSSNLLEKEPLDSDEFIALT